MKPLLSAFAPDAPLFVRFGGPTPLVISASAAAGAVERLAAALPRARHSIQCCSDTLTLALGMLAAWRAGQTVVMPSTRVAADVARLRERFPDSYTLDAAQFARSVHAAIGSGPQPHAADAARALLAAAPARWPAFSLDAAHPAIVLFTSGSTREPQAHAKTWDALCRGAESFRRAFAPLSSAPLLAGTVDCHHMFGLEANLMASIHCGYALCTDRPQWPADLRGIIAAASRQHPAPLWLVTTPLQLSAFHRGNAAAPGDVERVIVATMPLAPSLATDVERDWRTRVDEIYGNTECGVMATRRPATHDSFAPAPGVEFRFLDDETASVARVPDAPRLLDDRVAEAADGGFLLLGRRGDMVKVAGKRTTLRALDDHLLAIAGVADGAFFIPHDARERVAAFAVAPAHTPVTLLAELALRVDGAFLPRPLLLADALPRDVQGKLARAALLQMAAAHAVGGARGRPSAITRQHVFARAHPAFDGHFPGYPIVPGAVLLAEIESLLDAHGYAVVGCDSAKFLAPVAPDVPCTMRVDCADPRRVPFEIVVAERISVRGVFRCAPFAVAADATDGR